jgi:alpha-D-ribose 1-methylphosphonate 5-triphosphate synthase subunit PhnI
MMRADELRKLGWLQKAIGRAPQEPMTVEVETQDVRFGDRVIKATVPDRPRNQLVGGTWDSTAVLLEAETIIEFQKVPDLLGIPVRQPAHDESD